ncbi:hypothetical protein [Streptomyces sp. NRRL S-118]|uniref:hypothetical protein n=1 Tax=Streptomyces sp. NRRL S-118 TaxID=1463881 RepID=UPI000694EB19|nr:hypothetical protein [Streptomyces sp. NRRL S-118]
MNTGLKVTAFAAALAAAFGAAYGVGAGMDPVVAGGERVAGGGGAAHAEHAAVGGGEAALPGGLLVSQGGYTLDLHTRALRAGESAELRFAVLDERTGRNVTAFRREHGKELHLIVASRDLTTYWHLHPARAADGTWSTPVRLPEAGGHRVFADFRPAGKDARGLTLGADLAVSGTSVPDALPPHSATATVDGYQVHLEGGLTPGAGSELTFAVTRAGKPVTDLEPYLGAYGHLVALRAGDLAYLHVHPNGEPGDGRTRPGPGISFTATAPSTGTFRLFLDFRHGGKVRTASFTVHAGRPAAAGPAEAGQEGGGGYGPEEGRGESGTHAH